MLPKAICVYCSSRDDLSTEYQDVARQLGESIARAGSHLVYGGASVGLMGIVAEAVNENGGKVIGVIPKKFDEHEIVFHEADELIYTNDLRERKGVMDDFSDAFVALPGGFGTLDEVAEIITLKQLDFHRKPIVFINTNGFWNNLLNMFERFYQDEFANDFCRKLYHVATDIPDAIKYLDEFDGISLPEDFLKLPSLKKSE